MKASHYQTVAQERKLKLMQHFFSPKKEKDPLNEHKSNANP